MDPWSGHIGVLPDGPLGALSLNFQPERCGTISLATPEMHI